MDTQAPAKFKPVAEVLFAGQQAKAFISFFTTDAHSGIDHYEDIGVTVGATLLAFVHQHIYALLGLLLGIIMLYVLAHLHFWSRMGRYRELVKRLNEEEHLAQELSHHHTDIQSKKRP